MVNNKGLNKEDEKYLAKLHEKYKGKDMPKVNIIPDLVKHLNKLKGMRINKEFYQFLQDMPNEIDKEALELFLLILKANRQFNTLSEIHDYVYKTYQQGKKPGDPGFPKYIHSKDKKHFIGKTGIINALVYAGLIEKAKPSQARKKKTWKNQTYNIIMPKWEYRLSDGKTLIIERTKEDMIHGLENYLYKNEPIANYRELIEMSIKGSTERPMTEQEKKEYLINALLYEYGLLDLLGNPYLTNFDFNLMGLPAPSTLLWSMDHDFNKKI